METLVNIGVVQNSRSSSYLTNDTIQHFVKNKDGSVSNRTLCGIWWRRWSGKPTSVVTGTLCSKCEKIAVKSGMYRTE